MKKKIELQIFADDAEATETVTAENTTKETAAAEQIEGDTRSTEPRKEKKYSDEDVDEILGKRFARWQKEQQRAVDEAQKLATMNATQKAEYERDRLQKELDEYKRKDSLAAMTKTARKMLADEGISVTDELLSLLVTTEAEDTKAAVDGFTKLFKEAVESAVKERLKGEPPKKGAGGAAPMTKEAIMAIKDHELRQKKMLENRELFNI